MSRCSSTMKRTRRKVTWIRSRRSAHSPLLRDSGWTGTVFPQLRKLLTYDHNRLVSCSMMVRIELSRELMSAFLKINLRTLKWEYDPAFIVSRLKGKVFSRMESHQNGKMRWMQKEENWELNLMVRPMERDEYKFLPMTLLESFGKRLCSLWSERQWIRVTAFVELVFWIRCECVGEVICRVNRRENKLDIVWRFGTRTGRIKTFSSV